MLFSQKLLKHGTELSYFTKLHRRDVFTKAQWHNDQDDTSGLMKFLDKRMKSVPKFYTAKRLRIHR